MRLEDTPGDAAVTVAARRANVGRQEKKIE
jgi:hypothetical protein